MAEHTAQGVARGERVGPPPRRSVRRRVVLAVLVLAAVMVVLLSVLAMLGARAALADGRSAAEDGLAAARDGDFATADERFAVAEERFGLAGERLGSFALAPARIVPVVGRQIAAVTTLAESGRLLASAAGELTGAMSGFEGGLAALAPQAGVMPVDDLASLAEPAAVALERLDAAALELEEGPRAGLVGPVREASVEMAGAVATAREPVEVAVALTRSLPSFLGADGPRRYFVAAQNPAELRGTGGYMGAYTLLVVDGGAITIEGFGPIQDLPIVPPDAVEPPNEDFADRYDDYGGAGFWPNVNMTPDFPSAAVAIERSYEVATGTSLDGVIAADPFALAALLELSGRAVEVPGLGPVTSEEVVDVVANEAYGQLTDPEARKRLLGTIATQALGDVLSGRAEAPPADVVSALAEAAQGQHVLLHARDDEVQEAFRELGVSGGLPTGPGDLLAVVANNGAANKVDYYTQREVRYAVSLEEDGAAHGELAVTLANEAPDGGLPAYVIGPNVDGLEAGDNRTILSIFCGASCELSDFGRSSGDQPLVPETELGHEVYTTTVEVAAGQAERVTLGWDAEAAWQPDDLGGRYRLTYRGQPAIRPTRLVVEITLPPRMRVVGLPDGATLDGRVVRWEGDPMTQTSLELDLRSADAPPEGWWGEVRTILERPLAEW